MPSASGDSNHADGHSPSRPRTMWERLSATFYNAPTSKASKDTSNSERPLTDDETRRRITLLDPKERKVGYYGAALATIIALIYTLPYVTHLNKAVSQTQNAKGKSCTTVGFKYNKSTKKCDNVIPLHHWVEIMLLLLFFAGILLIAVRVNRRAPTGFAALMTGLAFETYVGIFGLPFIFGGGWLLMRAWRVQRYGSPTGRAPAAGTANSKAKTAEPTKQRERTKRATNKEADARRSAPTASKRYTPKPARKKRPTPSA